MLQFSANKEDLAWAAGFLEGEGSFCYKRPLWARHGGKPTRSNCGFGRLEVSAAQKEREPLEKLLSIFPFGKIYGPYNHKNGRSKPHYRLSYHKTDQAQTIMAAVWPWLSSRRKEQITKALTSMRECK